MLFLTSIFLMAVLPTAPLLANTHMASVPLVGTQEAAAPKKRHIGTAWRQASQWVYLPSMDDSKEPQKSATTQQQPASQAPVANAPAPRTVPERSQQFLADLQSVLDEEYEEEDYGYDDLEGFENLPEVQLSPEEEAEFTAFLMNALQGNGN